MLQINDLTYSYPHRRRPVIKDVTLQINPGNIYGLLGENGVGKSTLLYLISGLLTPDSGEVLMEGINTRLRYPSTLREIFLVPEEIDLPSMPIEKFLKLNAPFYPRFSEADFYTNLDNFKLDHDIHLGRLSMGQKKKAFMSFALATNTKLLLMDEPTNGLDIPGKAAFRSFIASSMTDDRAIIISTHQVQDINRLLDHVIIMSNDSIILDRSVREILDRLAFRVTDDRDLIDRAFYSQPSVEGTNVIVPNDEGIETEINLETLFQLAIARRDVMKVVFEKTNIEESLIAEENE